MVFPWMTAVPWHADWPGAVVAVADGLDVRPCEFSVLLVMAVLKSLLVVRWVSTRHTASIVVVSTASASVLLRLSSDVLRSMRPPPELHPTAVKPWQWGR